MNSRSPVHARLLWRRWRHTVARLTAGGRWTDRLPASVRNNLRWFWFDGLFAQASEAIVVAYTTLFVLALGASRTQIGLMSALSSLSAALLLLPGAALAERWGRNKLLCLISGGLVGRLALLGLALLPLALHGPAGVYAAIGLAVARDAFSGFSVPAWTALTAQVVPLQWRGRYFSSRNIVMGLAGLSVTYLVGTLITRVGSPAGYQLALGLAFVCGLASTFCFAQLKEPPAAPRSSGRLLTVPLVDQLRAHPDFALFCVTAIFWNFSLNLAGPFFNVYLVENLGASAAIVGALTAVSGIAALPAYRLFGPLTDRWGPRRVQLVTGLLIPFMPAAWAFIRSPWQVVPINLAAGFLWAGYGLASFNFLLSLTPEEHRARYSAFYQIAVTLALAAGAAVGGLVATRWGYSAIFLLSGLGRLIAALLFMRFVRAPASPAPVRQQLSSSET